MQLGAAWYLILDLTTSENVEFLEIFGSCFGKMIICNHTKSDFTEFSGFQPYALVDLFIYIYGLKFNRNYSGGISLEEIDEIDKISRIVIQFSWY